jgi:hypothetical protein
MTDRADQWLSRRTPSSVARDHDADAVLKAWRLRSRADAAGEGGLDRYYPAAPEPAREMTAVAIDFQAPPTRSWPLAWRRTPGGHRLRVRQASRPPGACCRGPAGCCRCRARPRVSAVPDLPIGLARPRTWLGGHPGQPRLRPLLAAAGCRPPSLTCLFSELCRARRHPPQVPGLGLLQLVGALICRRRPAKSSVTGFEGRSTRYCLILSRSFVEDDPA